VTEAALQSHDTAQEWPPDYVSSGNHSFHELVWHLCIKLTVRT